MSLLEKILLVVIGFAPFIFLIGNATRKISFGFLPATVISAGCGAFLMYLNGLGRHPHVSSVFFLFFFLWPVALIAAKSFCTSFTWKQLWFSVPIMSWFTVNAAISLDYPVNGGGGGFAMLVTLCIGWFYLIPIFGVLQLLYLLVAALLRRIAKRPETGKP